MKPANTQERLGREPALEGREARLHRGGRGAAARQREDRAHAREARRREALEAVQRDAVRAIRSARSPATRRCSRCKAGVPAIYLSGWQVAADANDSLLDVSRPVALRGDLGADGGEAHQQRAACAPTRSRPWKARATSTGSRRSWPTPKSGFGGVLNAFELMKAMIDAGAAGVHFEDQLASVKKCGHMGGKVLVPTQEAVQKLIAARLAADVMGVPTVLLARTDAEAADIVTTDVDENDKPFLTGERTSEGFYKTRKGFDQALSRGLAYAEYADMVWCETGTPDLDFAQQLRRGHPQEVSRTRCSPTTARRRSTGSATSTTRPSPSSSASSARWATSSSSSRWPASTRSTTRCSSSPTATRATT